MLSHLGGWPRRTTVSTSKGSPVSPEMPISIEARPLMFCEF